MTLSDIIFLTALSAACYFCFLAGRTEGRIQGLDMAQMMIAGHVLRKYNVVSIHDILDSKDRKDAEDTLKIIGWDR